VRLKTAQATFLKSRAKMAARSGAGITIGRRIHQSMQLWTLELAKKKDPKLYRERLL